LDECSSIEPTAMSGVYKNMTRAIVNLVLWCKITGGGLAANEEATNFRWASEAEVPRTDGRGTPSVSWTPSTRPPPRPCAHNDGVHLL